METIQDYPSSYSYITTQNQNVYYIPSVVLGKEYVKVIINNVTVNTNVYDIINNSLVLYFKPLDGLVLQVKVASSVKGISQLDFETSQEAVLDAMVKMNALIRDIDIIKNVRNNLSYVVSVADNITNVSIVSSNSDIIMSIADNIAMFDSPDIKNHNSAVNRDTPNSHTMESIEGLIQTINSIQLAGVFPTKYKRSKEKDIYILAKQGGNPVSLNVDALVKRKFIGDYNKNPYFTNNIIANDIYNIFPNKTFDNYNNSYKEHIMGISPDIEYPYRSLSYTDDLVIRADGHIGSLTTYSNTVPTVLGGISYSYFITNKEYTDDLGSSIYIRLLNDNTQFVEYIWSPKYYGHLIKSLRLFNISYNDTLLYVGLDNNMNIEEFITYSSTYRSITSSKTGKSISSNELSIDGETYRISKQSSAPYTPNYASVNHLWKLKRKYLKLTKTGITGLNLYFFDFIGYLSDTTGKPLIDFLINLGEEIASKMSFYPEYDVVRTSNESFTFDVQEKRGIVQIGKIADSNDNKYVLIDLKNNYYREIDNTGYSYHPILLPRDKQGNDYTYHKTSTVVQIKKNNIVKYVFSTASYSFPPLLFNKEEVFEDDFKFLTDSMD